MIPYAQDYDETLPSNNAKDEGGSTSATHLGFMDPTAGRNWAREIQPYVKNLGVHQCPSGQLNTASTTIYQAALAPGSGSTGYLLNGIVEDRPLTVIPEPANIIFLHEIDLLVRVCETRPWLRSIETGYLEFNHNRYNEMHNGGGNLLFCDGHAKWQKKTAIRPIQFGVLPTQRISGPRKLCSKTTAISTQPQTLLPFRRRFSDASQMAWIGRYFDVLDFARFWQCRRHARNVARPAYLDKRAARQLAAVMEGQASPRAA